METKAQFIERIAQETLFIPTLAVRGRDSLDFHEVSVGSVADALEEAFNAGMMAAQGHLALALARG